MSTHNICFRQEIRKILCGYPLYDFHAKILLNDRIMDSENAVYSNFLKARV